MKPTSTLLRLSLGAAVAALLVSGACSSGNERSGNVDPGGGTKRPDASAGTTGVGGTGGTGATGGTGGTKSDVVRPPVDAPDDTFDAANCGTLTCPGASMCVEGDGGRARCVCDPGFIEDPNSTDFSCIPDESCINVRFLEEGCRIQLNGPPAVGLFFAVDTCAGTAVLPGELGNLDEAFQILEDGIDIKTNPEASATIIERDVESFVTITVDVSKSLTDNATLVEQLSTQLRGFVSSLSAALKPTEPPITVEVLVFGRFVVVLQPATTDLAKVDTALARIENDTAGVQALVGGDGTSLFSAVERSIHETERMMQFRRVVSDSGVLTSGTVVVVTDGQDTSGALLDPNLLEDTRVNVISVGISNDIDDAELTQVGRDGSFLAPRPEDWEATFDEIAKRVDEHPDRAYLLGYCSSATAGTREVTIGMADKAKYESVTPATCEFRADFFSTNPADKCDAAFFANVCNGAECGGLLACGACPDSQCCAQNRCRAPAPVVADCNDQQELCEPGPTICADDPSQPGNDTTCRTPLAIGEVCDAMATSTCDPREATCEDVPVDGGAEKRCVAIDKLAPGASCDDGMNRPLPAERCATSNCSRKNPDNPVDPLVCRPGPARMFDRCAGQHASAECEVGTVCKGDRCELRGPSDFFTCSSDSDCAQGFCDDTGTKLCVETGFCHYSWSDKLE